jgi:hypothetical protein
MVHNGLLLSIAYWSEELIARRWGIADQEHLPLLWLALSMLGIFVGTVILVTENRSRRELDASTEAVTS